MAGSIAVGRRGSVIRRGDTKGTAWTNPTGDSAVPAELFVSPAVVTTYLVNDPAASGSGSALDSKQ